MGKEFIATFVDIKNIDNVAPEIAPYVDFKISHEGREILGGERIAIFNIATTASYAVVFLDEGKTIEAVEEELLRDSYAVLDPGSRQVISRILGV
jgi:hypothetical protein